MKTVNKIEYVFLLINVLACFPFIGSWCMTPPQFVWAAYKIYRLVAGLDQITEKDAYSKEIYMKHRKNHTMSLLFHLICWFVYFARA